MHNNIDNQEAKCKVKVPSFASGEISKNMKQEWESPALSLNGQ